MIGRALPIPEISLKRADDFIKDVPEEALAPPQKDEEEEEEELAGKATGYARDPVHIVSRRGWQGISASLTYDGVHVSHRATKRGGAGRAGIRRRGSLAQGSSSGIAVKKF